MCEHPVGVCPLCEPFPAAVVVSLAGPALLHTERAPAGERPALLQTVQRQPAPGHCEVVVTALGSCCPSAGSSSVFRFATAPCPPGRLLPWIHRSTASFEFSLPSPRPQLEPAGCVLMPTPGASRLLGIPLPGLSLCSCSTLLHLEVSGEIMSVSNTRQKRQRPLQTFVPSCHSTSLPRPALGGGVSWRWDWFGTSVTPFVFKLP